MKITEYWAKLVASGLAPKWYNVYAKCECYNNWVLSDRKWDYGLRIEIHHSLLSTDDCQEDVSSCDFCKYCYENNLDLRINGIDLYYLEWKKPTEQDIGKMCWFLSIDCYANKEVITYCELLDADFNQNVCYKVLLAKHGQIAPIIEDFKKVYGE